MDSSLFPKPYTQFISDYYKNMPRILPLNTSTAPNLVWFTISSCLDYCNSLKTSLSLLPPFVPNIAAREILFKYKSDHATQNLGQALHRIQSKHWSPCKLLHSLLSFHASSLTSSPTTLPHSLHSSHTWVFAVPWIWQACSASGLCMGCLSVWNALPPDTHIANSLTFFNSAQNVTFSVKSILTTLFKITVCPFEPSHHHPPHSIIFLFLMFIDYCLSTPF